MHFVKKVATTEEQKLKIEKERTEKLKIYCKLRDRIFEKRMKGELDEEMLLLTASLLEKNPDIYTFWNIRRQVINLLSMKLSEESDEENTKRKDRIFLSELLLTEASLKSSLPSTLGYFHIFCIKANSKSYCAWFYRLWCFKQLSNPDIAEELAACEKFLKLDGRNFHCWDYRREIARFGSHSAEEELKFSDRLINANFSNYSSWHYRSSLLPSLFPDTENQLTVDKPTLYNEYRKLENAFFTDPEDQSAWIFAEWLLLSDEKRKKYDIDSVHLLGLMFDFTPYKCSHTAVSYLSVTFDRAIKLTRISDFVVVKMKNGDQWTPFKNSEMVDNRTFRASNSYRFEIDDEIAECHLRPSLGEPYEIIDMESGYVNFDEIYHIYHIKCKPVNEARRIIIEKLMDNCQELLSELKVEQKQEILKWPLLTYTFAILELEPIKMFSTILTNLEELATNVDPQRCEMYEEMAMNLRINEKLRQKIDNVHRIDILFRQVDGHFVGKLKLDNLGLKSIDHLKYLSSFITHLDLTGNKFTNLCIFESFRRLTHLRLFNNPITSFKGISMLPQLDYLSVVEMAKNDLDVKDDFALKKIRMLEFEESEQSVKV
ncbi:Protein prenyltransferase alpha subunit repeat containing protein [Brugia malayi]|uniref:Geranylgeranyl transferase type-2 subunit alpha n=2 Tax=Brugia TaxID=6278 RepID=A0A0H5S8Y7_BRUMA|nr:Protein prenyltransferase alpha subunit repeat containing protein [Brugia malayi]CRZ25051.1 Bm5120 [Brugia malayi]VIO88477.1 Protein prenyltransferase alpha subunit repeat containing protein [Brugia malayi]